MRSSNQFHVILLVLILSSVQISGTLFSNTPPSDQVLREISGSRETRRVLQEILLAPRVARNIEKGLLLCLELIYRGENGQNARKCAKQEIIICNYNKDPYLWTINPIIRDNQLLREDNQHNFIRYTKASETVNEHYWEIRAQALESGESEGKIRLQLSALEFSSGSQIQKVSQQSQIIINLPHDFNTKENEDQNRIDLDGQTVTIVTKPSRKMCRRPATKRTIILSLIALSKKDVLGMSLTSLFPFSDILNSFPPDAPPFYALRTPLLKNNDGGRTNGDASPGSPFAYGMCTRKSSTLRDPNERRKDFFYSPHFHNCGDDEYLHLSYTLPEGKGTEVVMVVADGIRSLSEPYKDPGLLTLSMMKFFYRFISLYPGWSPLNYLGVLLLIMRSELLLMQNQLGPMLYYIYTLDHGEGGVFVNQVWGEYLNAYMNHLGQGSSTLSMFKYNTNTYSFSYANIGDSGFIVLRKDNDDNYKVVMKSNRGKKATKYSYEIKLINDGQLPFFTRFHTLDEKDSNVRYGLLYGDEQKYVTGNIEFDFLTKSDDSMTMINVLPESIPISNLPKLQRGDVIIGASDGLLDNLHDVEVEAHVTLAARNLPPNGNEGTSANFAQRLQTKIAQVLYSVVSLQMLRKDDNIGTNRRNYLSGLQKQLPILFANRNIKYLIPIPFRTQGGDRWYQKEDDLTIVVSVVP